MRPAQSPQADPFLPELLGTFLEVSARSAPASYSLRRVADAFDQWAVQQPVVRLAAVYEHLVAGRLDPPWEELGLAASNG